MNYKLIKKIIFKNNLGNHFSYKIINEGRNNKVFKIIFRNKNYILKFYDKELNNSKSRFLREVEFYKYIKKIKYKNTASIIDHSKKELYILFTFIKGNKISKINSNHYNQINNFLKFINKNKTTYPLTAIDACLSIKDHINLLEKKFSKLSKIISINKSLNTFYNSQLLIKKSQVLSEIYSNLTESIINKKYSKNKLVVSPSDFGFHNIKLHQKEIFFFDFEYSGLDDPLKLICDLIAHPYPDFEMSKSKINKLLKNFELSQKDIFIFNLLLPLHKLKWCLIILNDFIPEKKLQREFSKSRHSQNIALNKSKKYFKKSFSKL